jgi:hypothetical protein
VTKQDVINWAVLVLYVSLLAWVASFAGGLDREEDCQCTCHLRRSF